MKNRRKIFLLVIIISFILILTGSYFNNYNLLKEPPSQTWSKEVKIGTGAGKNTPVIIKEEDRLLVAYDDTKKIKVCETDLNGVVQRTFEYDTDEELFKNIAFARSNDGYVLMYNSSVSQENYMEYINLDKELNVVTREKVKGVDSIYQIDSNNLTIAYSNRIEVVNTLNNVSSAVPAEKVSMISASKCENRILVCYLQNDELFKAVTVEDGVASESFLVKEMKKTDNIVHTNMSSSSDKENGYILVEESTKGEYKCTKVIKFPVLGGAGEVSNLSVNDSEYIVNTKGANSEDGGKFYATMTRDFGKKETQQGIVSFTVKDGQTYDAENVTRLRNLSIFPYSEADYTVFLGFEKRGGYSINIASTSESFKEANNRPRGDEKISALRYTAEGFIYSISYIIIVGFRWLAPLMVISGVVSFLDYKLNDKKKRYMYIILSLVGIALKTKIIYDTFYVQYAYMFPSILAPVAVGICINILIGLIVYWYGYEVYIDDLEGIFIGKFTVFMLMDALLSLMVFVPLIV